MSPSKRRGAMLRMFLPVFIGAAAICSGDLLEQFNQCKEREELPFLRQLASNCASIAEIGADEIVPMWALLLGLSENGQEKTSYIRIAPDYFVHLNELILAAELASPKGISFQSMEEPDFYDADMVILNDPSPSDLETFSAKAKQYLVVRGGADSFMAAHPEWTLRNQQFSEFAVLEKAHAPSFLYRIEEKNHLPDDPKELYIDVMKKILANTIYEDASYQGDFNPEHREYGFDHPKQALTMVGMKRLDNLHFCMQEILKNQIPGDCIETGVWRGGCTILMRAILKAFGDTERKVWVADSYTGVPPPNLEKYPQDRISPLHTESYHYLAVPLTTVKNNFKKFGLLDSQVVFLKGLFSDTLPKAPIEQLALMRLDGDLYESTLDALTNLYPKLSVGGFVIIDDFGSNPNCVEALTDYRREHQIEDPFIPIDFASVYWQKTKP